jgi:hypothetical protein
MANDTTYQVFQHYGTNAQRLAFTPAPAAGIQPIYIWYETDTDNYYIFTTVWKGPFSSGGTGTVTTTGSPASGNLTKFSGATSITNADLSGDVTTSGTAATTIAANAVTTTKITNAAVTLAKIQNAANNSRLLGSGSSGSGSAYTELTAGAGLSIGASSVALSTAAQTRAITLAIDGGGSTLTTGIKADVYVPYACTITANTMLADQSGSVVVDIWKVAYGSYPATVTNSITASALPTITTALKSQDSTLTGWTTSISAGDTLRFNINSVTSITRLNLTLTVTVS